MSRFAAICHVLSLVTLAGCHIHSACYRSMKRRHTCWPFSQSVDFAASYREIPQTAPVPLPRFGNHRTMLNLRSLNYARVACRPNPAKVTARHLEQAARRLVAVFVVAGFRVADGERVRSVGCAMPW